ncbi:protein CIP2A homolog isoform X1 [Hippoglossus hippoglossus]|uniref:protein CIP2A homolog isoform X1 n=1 Tax=Hippoglossus hippoglossus TaxID=8267 RepID=UPI00148CDB71|nr:protein CIP2A homolog isoform X1 [Hippoglossus hippoglossus]XP_034427581.1 protein CIP2A homolog isoform X1 [Hippoglossus hippoglossus]
MDLTTCLKSLLLAIQQYRGSRTTHNTAQLHKQVEEVSGLRCDQLLSSGQVLPSECVSGLVELAGNPNTNPSLTSSIISLLAQLACDDDSREMLHSSYNLTSTLASVIHCHSVTPADPLVLQCLQVLQKLTYSTRTFQSTNYIHELIAFLMTNIQSHNDDIIMPCLGLMANLCRDNHSVQSHIKSLDNVKPFYRTLINFLAHNSLTVVVFTLSILSSLTLNEKVGEKLFDAKNIHQTFQLVFNIIVNGDGTLTRKYSVDLLVDLLKNCKIAEFLTRYQHFSACLSQVLGLLQSKDPDSAAKVLELLLAMCSVSGLRSLLCDVVFKPAAAKLRAPGRRQGPGLDNGGRKEQSGLALVQWLSSPVEGAESCSLQALHLLHELLKESLGADSIPDRVVSFIEMLLPVLLGLLRGLDPAKGDAHLRKHCHRITHVNSLLLLLCTDDSTRSIVSRQVSAQLCLSQAESLLSCCHGNNPLTCLPPGSDNDLSQVCAEALLKTLELMSKLRQQVKDMETSFYRMLQDQRIATPLSLALTSHHRQRVQTGLSLLFEATPLPDFPSLVLGESIAANNAYRPRDCELSVKRVAVQEVPPPRVNTSVLDSSSGTSRGVHSLVEKMQNGLGVKTLQEPVKDSHVSEIIDVYAQKISAFASQESRLQDLLEAKALALSQADRLLAQFRFQRAQAEAEALKLGSLLKEAERRREDLQSELSNQVLEVKRSKADMEELLQHNARLQQDTEEHQGLKGGYNALLNRFNESERLLREQQVAHVALTKQSDALRKNHEALQLQHEKMASELEERGEQVRSLRSDLQQKNSDITGLRGELRAEEEKVKEKDQERRDLEDTVDVLRKELNKTEQARKDASIKASSLELQKSQLETKLKQKEDELNKHSAMISMIHSLSSGKMKSDVNLSL